MRWLGKMLCWFLIGLVVLGMSAWGLGAIYYAGPTDSLLRSLLTAVYGLVSIGAFVLLLRHRRAGGLVLALLWMVLLVWWSTILPSNDRNWQPSVAVLPYATVDGDRITLHNIRRFAYRTETDFTPQYDDKTVDLRQLETIDLIASYWGSEAIAHLFVSFGFGGQDYVAVSIETRMERDERYSSLAGFFKQYELIYVVADERDIIRLRTHYRQQPPEDVFLYRIRISPERARRFFMTYVEQINALKTRPEFYHTLTTNCTTNILFHAQAAGGRARYNWKVLLSGYAPEYAYEVGSLDTSLPFAELRQRSHINAHAQAADDAADFSRQIRMGLPTPRPVTRDPSAPSLD
jgi:hypothetical protein